VPSRSASRRVLAGAIALGAALLAAPGTAWAAAGERCPDVPGGSPSGIARGLVAPLAAGPASPAATDAALRALDALSPRIRTFVAGRTPEGRPLRYVVVGDPRAIGDRDLAAGRRDAARRPSAQGRARPDGPVTAWLTGAVHANEPSGTPALLTTVAALAADESCAGRRVLDRVVTVVVPDLNPDGAARGTRTNAAGFDLNRDWSTTTQPETAAWWGALRRLPPTVLADLHEQSGTGYFTPPYAPPVLPALGGPARRVADRVIAPAVDRALGRLGPDAVRPAHRGYDLLYPGYADSALGLAFGAATMTLEQGSDAPFAVRVARHAAAARAVLGAVADHADRVGRAVRAQRSRRVAVAGWALPAGARDADRIALAASLRRRGVLVAELRRATRVRAVDAADPGRRGPRVRLPAGSTVIDADQPRAAWLSVLLADDAAADPAGADPWSLPRLASLEVVPLARPLPRERTRPVSTTTPTVVPAGAVTSFPAGDAGALRVAMASRTVASPVRVAPDGRLWLHADAATGGAMAAAGVRPRREPTGPPDDAVALRSPRIAVLRDPTPPLTGPPSSLPGPERRSGWITWWLRRAGTPVDVVDGAVPVAPGTTHVVLGPAAPPFGVLGGTGIAALRAFAAGGGSIVLLGDAVDAASRAGLTGVTTARGPDAPAHLRATAGADVVTLTGPVVDVVVAGERRLLAPAGATTSLRAGDRPLVVRERVGAGEVVSVGFSPTFRGFAPGGEAVLAALLLTPPG